MGVEESDCDDDELGRHEDAKNVEGDLKERPSWSLEEFVGSWREDESVPSSDGEGAHHQILKEPQ